MPSLRLKRNVKSVVDGATLLPGELAVATDTGDVYAGKGDGTKTKIIQLDEIDDNIFTGDNPLAWNIDVTPGIIGPLKMNETDILLADGQSFSALAVSGQLTGSTGLQGPKGDTGDIGNDSYDKIIRTQEEFNQLLASPTWLDAKSVALVGDGGITKFTRSDGQGCLIPSTVKQIHGFNNAIIELTGFIRALYYEIRPTGSEYGIYDLTVNCINDAAGVAFYNCTNLTNCTGNGNGSTVGTGFANCTNLTNCVGNGTHTGDSPASANGFANCTNLTNCTGNGNSTGNGGWGYGFTDCKKLVNCQGTGIGYDTGYGFEGCNDLTNCSGLGNGSGSCTGFYQCTGLMNCDGSGRNTSGYGSSFMNCNYLSGCKRGSVASDGFMNGANTNIDALTVAASWEV